MKEKILQVAKEEFGLTTLAIEFFVDKLEPLINQEVEKRIKERMPDINIEEAEEMAKATDYACFAVESPGNPINFADAASFFLDGWYACRSRLTNPESSQKSEGGGE